MANWEILNKKFDEVIDSMTPEKWKKWKENRALNKLNRKNKMLDKLGVLYGEDAKIFLEKMEANNKNIGKETPKDKYFDYGFSENRKK